MQTDLEDAQKATESVYDAASQVRTDAQLSAPQKPLIADQWCYAPPYSTIAFWSIAICSIIGCVLIFKVLQRSRDTITCSLCSIMILLVPIWLGVMFASLALNAALETIAISTMDPKLSEIFLVFDSVRYPLTFAMWWTLPGLLLLAGGLYYRATRTSASA
jgi:hypothetical protein